MAKAGLRFSAGVWEQNADGDGFVEWSKHGTKEAAQAAARRYAKRLYANGSHAGGALSWSGGWREDGGKVHWTGPGGR